MSRQGRIGPGQQWSAGWPSRILQELNHPSSDALARAWSIAAIAPALGLTQKQFHRLGEIV
jgi:hypothetical protein